MTNEPGNHEEPAVDHRRPPAASNGNGQPIDTSTVDLAPGQPATEPVADAAPAGAWPAVPGYVISGEIARGGMGRVLAGRDLALDREVAIKTLLPGADAERFVTESKITARLPHPGIPPVHALGTLAEGSPYLVMKRIRGRTLNELLKGRQSPGEDLSTWVQVFEQMAQAVGFAHAQGIIHRDLKPLNVMVGAFGEVQVMDWGLAKDLKGEGQRTDEPGQVPSRSSFAAQLSSLTQRGAILGTPGYMAPEQARGEAVDARADVFALGSILTVILTGKPAFVGPTASATIAQAAAADLVDALARLAVCGADADLIALARCCLAASAADRPADAHAVADRVAAYRANVETRLRQAEAERSAAAAREAEQRKRRRQLLISAAVIAGVLVAGIIGTAVGMMAAQHEAGEKGRALEAEADARQKEKDRADGEARATKEALARRDEARRHLELVFGVVADIDYQKARQENLALTDELAGRLVQAAQHLDKETVTDPRDLALLRNRVGMTLLSLGYAKDAVSLFTKALEKQKAVLGADHPNTLTSMNNLAAAYQAVGDLESALPLLEKTRELRKATLGPDHADTLTSMNNLAEGYRAVGKLDLALPLLETTLQRRKATLGPDHDETLTSMNNLAGAYRDAGKWDLALPAFEEIFKLRKDRLGADHPSTLVSLSNLAAACNDADKLEQALPLYKEALEISKAKLGADHPDTLTRMNNLAAGYFAAGKPDLALPLFEESLKYLKAKVGADHPKTLASMNNLAANYVAAGKMAQALPHLEATLWIRKARFGPDHPDTLTSTNNLAEAYRKLGKLDLALPLYEENLKQIKVQLGPDHPNTLTSMNNLAEAYRNANKLDLALPLYEETLQLKKSKWGSDHQDTLLSMLNLAVAYCDAKHGAKAAPLFADYMAKKRKRLPPGKESADYQGELVIIGQKLIAVNEFAAAEAHFRELHRLLEKSPTLFKHYAGFLLGSSLALQKKYADAEPLLLQSYQVLKVNEKSIPIYQKQVLGDAAAQLVKLYEATKRPADAAKWAKALAAHRQKDAKLLEPIHEIGKGVNLAGKLDAATSALVYQVRLKAGVTYVIDMVSPNQLALDPYLFLGDENGKTLAEDDDSGGGLNARITYTAPADGVYRIRATSFNNGRGDFTLTVRPKQ